jgi:uncharacterized protein YkwD
LASSLLFISGMKFLAVITALLFTQWIVQAQDYTSGILEEINLARTSPAAYAQIVASRSNPNDRDVKEAIAFLKRAKPLPELSFSTGMSAGASLHVAQQGSAGTKGHGGSQFRSPSARVKKFGAWTGALGENIYYGSTDARGVVVAWIVDKGVRNRGHRKNIFSRSFNVAGIAAGHHSRFGKMCVIDFAGGYTDKGRVAVQPWRSGVTLF